MIAKYNDMALMNKRILIQDLIDRTELIQEAVQKFFRLDEEELNYKSSAERWSIAEIFEHLNLTQHIYLKYIHERVDNAQGSESELYKSGWLGDWYYEKMTPKPDGSVYKIKASKIVQPASSTLEGKIVLNKFFKQIHDIQHVLEHSYNLNLEKTRIPFSFTKLFSLRLGDNLRCMVAHCERHLLQANKVLEEIQNRKSAIAV